MENSTILTADILDIIFEGRNKEYGAYELRRSYRRRLATSITVMLSIMLLVFAGFAFTKKAVKADAAIVIPDPTIIDLLPHEKPVEPPPPPVKPPAPPPQVQTLRVTPPRIVPDAEVHDDEKPPVNEELEDVKIGTMKTDGLKDDGTMAPPAETGNRGVIELPKKEEEDWTKIFTKVEIPSEYPGGASAWQRFLRRNLNYPQDAIENGIQGFVLVQFIVDTEGYVSDVVAISGPEELRAEAVRVIMKSGKWTPAIQNGHKVKSYKQQSIGFQMGTE